MSVFILMINASISLTANHSMSREMPYKVYENYKRCSQAADFYKAEEKAAGISYYCVEMEVLK